MEIDINKINPRVISARPFDFSPNIKSYILNPRVCYNYEIEYYTECFGGVMVNGEYITFKSGDINFRKPNELVCGIPSYKGYIICFSLLKEIPNQPEYQFGDTTTKEDNYQNELLNNIPSKLSPGKNSAMKELLQEIVTLKQTNEPLQIFKANSAMYRLLEILFEHMDCSNKTSYHHKNISRCKRYIEAHYLEEIAVADLIALSGLSKAHFHRCFKSHVGLSPLPYMIKLRMEKAKDLLIHTNDKVSEIALTCSYADSVYFTSLFRKYVGLSPSQYRKTYSNCSEDY